MHNLHRPRSGKLRRVQQAPCLRQRFTEFPCQTPTQASFSIFKESCNTTPHPFTKEGSASKRAILVTEQR